MSMHVHMLDHVMCVVRNGISTNSTVCVNQDLLCMWQSRVEIEGYSVAYFDRIAAFKAPYC